MIEFRPAKMDKTPLLIGLAGPSGSGKTYSALRMAKGIANGGKIIMIDTEARRGLHYAKYFDFQHGEMKAPFRPEAYLDAIQAATKAGAAVVIIDSMSHEHEGQGGILEWQQEEVIRMAGDDMGKRERVKFSAWIKPKASHNKLVNTLLQNQVHVVFCFRAKDKLELKTINGKQTPIEAGWQPICADRLEYEMTTLLVLPPGAKGVPDLSAKATKLQEQHKDIVKPGRQIDEAMGAALAAWASGDAGSASQAGTGDVAANKGSMNKGDTSGQIIGSPNTATPSLFQWIDGQGEVHNFPNAEKWIKHVCAGIAKAKDAESLDDAFTRNGLITHGLRLEGHGESVDKVLEELRSRMQNFNPLRAG
jgi:hypothetical protein